MNETAVPQTAMIKATPNATLSHHFPPFSRMWAKIGPMIQIVKALNEPRKDIIAEKFGMRTETVTDIPARRILVQSLAIHK